MAENLPCRFDLCQTALKEAICWKGWQHCPVRSREGPTRRQLKPSPGHTPSRSSFREGLTAQRERAVGKALLKSSKAVFPGPHCPTGRLPMIRRVHNIQGCRGEKERGLQTSLHFWLCWLQEVDLTSFSTGTMKRQPISKGSKDGNSETLTRMCWGQRATLLFKYFCKWHKPSKRFSNSKSGCFEAHMPHALNHHENISNQKKKKGYEYDFLHFKKKVCTLWG